MTSLSRYRLIGLISIVGVASSSFGSVAAQGTVPTESKVPAKQVSTASSVPAPQLHQQQIQLQLTHLLEQLTPYRPMKELNGKATLSGSSAMYDLGHQWALKFKQFHPGVEFSGAADGSDAGLQALASDPSVIAGVSRPVDQDDQKLLQDGKCKEPMAIIVATGAMSLCVHQDNPMQQLSVEQMQSLFGAEKNGNSRIKKWADLGVQGSIASQGIHVYGREDGSGTKSFVTKTILAGATAAKVHKEFASNDEVAKAIANDPNGIGLCDLHTHVPGIKKLSMMVNGQSVVADDSSVLAGKYPLMRPLILVIDRQQLQADGGLRESVLRYVLSKDGQTEVMKAGYYPLDPAFVRQQLDAIGGQQLR